MRLKPNVGPALSQSSRAESPTHVRPAEPTQAATIITTPPQVATAHPPRRQTGLLIVIVILLLAFGALATWHYRSSISVGPALAGRLKPAPTPQPPTTATVDVAPPPAPAPGPVPVPVPVPLAVPTAVPVTRPRTQPKKTIATPTETTETVEPQETQSEQTPSHNFVEGGEGSRNDAAIAFARERLRGVSRVSLDGRGDPDLVKQLGDLLGKLNLTVADGSNVVIRFYGTVKHLRFGKKERAAEATILKNGQPVFRYELKPEEYRVGDNPAEAFARKLSDVFGR